MDFLGAKWHLGTTSHFLVTLSITLIAFFIIFGGYQLLGKMQKKNRKKELNVGFFTLTLAVSVVIGRWAEKWIFS